MYVSFFPIIMLLLLLLVEYSLALACTSRSRTFRPFKGFVSKKRKIIKKTCTHTHKYQRWKRSFSTIFYFFEIELLNMMEKRKIVQQGVKSMSKGYFFDLFMCVFIYKLGMYIYGIYTLAVHTYIHMCIFNFFYLLQKDM